jgi:hypothetical protein
MTSINPDNKNHSGLEYDVKAHLDSLGYYTAEATYHSVMPRQITNRLAGIFTPTSLYIRGRADRIAVHKYKNIVFEWEAKTHDENNKYKDITIELPPLMHHASKSKLAVLCIYICRDNNLNRNCGFWAYKIPKIREIHFVNGKLSMPVEKFYKKQCEIYFPGVPIRNIKKNKGTGDPYVIIDKDVADSLHHWKQLIEEIG